MKDKIDQYFEITSENFIKLKGQSSLINDAAELITNALRNKNKVIFCGNGGSAADSQHLSAELMGRYLIDRDPLPAVAITVDTSALTAIGNDYGYEEVFARQLKGIGNDGDVLFALSTSGKSKNIINAIEQAKKMNIKIISLTGKNDSDMSKLSDITIKAPHDKTNHIQEMHIAIGHVICGIVEETIFNK